MPANTNSMVWYFCVGIHHYDDVLIMLQDDWLRRAELAVQKGEDELAKEALKRRKGYQVRCPAKFGTCVCQ